jgi:lipoprotein-releasing system permease protein
LLSAFNGIESIVEKLYSEFDSDVVIRSVKGKTFNENQIDFNKLNKVEGVARISKSIEEIVVLKNEKKWVNSRMIGVDSSFLQMSHMDNHIVEGFPTLNENNKDVVLVGASLLDNLGGYIPRNGYQRLLLYAPKRDAKVKFASNPFTTQTVYVSGKINYNKEVNSEIIVVPIRLAKQLLEYENDITSIFVDVKKGYINEDVKNELIKILPENFTVKTNYEKNELIFKTSKTEKIIVIIILIFIFILAAFNLVASLTMLFIEKMDNIKTMISFGADKKMIFRIFFYEGILISAKGILIGIVLGYLVCILQIYGGILQMPNTGGESFPMKLNLLDGFIILFLVSTLSYFASYFPVKYLLNKNFEKEVF